MTSTPFLVDDVNPGPGDSFGLVAGITGASIVDPDFTNVSGETFFRADDGSHGFELWKTNGSAGGTQLVKDIRRGQTSSMGLSFPYGVSGDLTNVNGVVFFAANDGSHGYELWKSNGTSSGTVLVDDIHPGSRGSYPSNLTNVSGTLFFTAGDGSGGHQLWRSNGTGASMVGYIHGAGINYRASTFTNMNGTLFFEASDSTNGAELWRSNGTSGGTQLVKDINPGYFGSFPFYLTNVNGTLFFQASDGVHGSQLWKSDGTAGGTQLVSDIHHGSVGSYPNHLTNVNGTLYFSANAGSGYDLWKSNGTSAGTSLVTSVKSPFDLTAVSGTLFFSANDGAHGNELWKSTSSGTSMVKDINHGAASSTPSDLTNVNGVLFFAANDGSHGNELWTSDGTSGGTTLVEDIQPGFAGSIYNRIADFTNVSGTLFFGASDGSHGYEPWAEVGPEKTPTLTRLSAATAAEGSAAFTLTVTGTNFDGTAVVRWNGTALATKFISATQLQAGVTAGLVAEEGTATVTVTEDTGTSGGLPFAITDAPLSGLTISNPPATEGVGLRGVTVATFTDANSGAHATDFTATVTWGDGGTTTVSGAGGGIVALGGGKFAVRASHTYAEEGNYTVAVQVRDDGGANTSANRKVSVADAPLSGLTIANVTATEGKSTGTIRVATFHDANLGAAAPDFTATLTWGDGTTTTVSGATGGIVALGSGLFSVNAGHTYSEEGHYTLSVQIRDDGGASASGVRGLGVSDAALLNLSVKNPNATAGHSTGTFTVATFHDTNLGAPTADFTAVIHWGDGTTSTLPASDFVSQGNGNFAVLASHLYAASGSFTLSVSVDDDGGASITGQLKISVAAA